MSRGQTRPPALEWPEWLVELAARDDPPTVIEPRLLARLARGGVIRLVLSDGAKSLTSDEAGRAVAIGAQGLGFGFGETFEDEPAPTAGVERLCAFVEGFDRLRRLRLAAVDMRSVASAARALADRTGPARAFERTLETGLVVTYARPYLDSNRAGVGRKWRPESEADRKLHDWIIDELRDPYHAHADHTPRRTLTDTSAYLGLDGPPTYAEAWWRLTDEELERIADLADRQEARFDAAARLAGAEIGERRDPPSGLA